MPDEPAPIHPAATTILVRDGDRGLETLLVRRNSQLAFHGGAWVFPGGRVDESDLGDEPDDLEGAARRAAIREAHEEAGLLSVNLDLVPFSHWTTPPGQNRRFATWFFIAPAPEGAVVVDGAEVTDHRWFTPTEALAAQAAQEIELPPPTFCSLTVLSEAASAAEALAAAAAGPYLRFEPHVTKVDGGLCFVYAGDVAYDEPDRFEEPAPRHRLWSVKSGWRYERA